VKTDILSTHTPQLFAAAVKFSADLLRAGQVVALPSETVYGLAANALDSDAVAKIFQAKGRPAHNPVIVHVASLDMARACAREWPETARKLSRAFWPGPLTLVLPKANCVPPTVTAGGDTVGIRWPAHPFMQAVIRECGFPLAAPSANLSNRISPTHADHVSHQLDGKIPLIVDGGQSQVGIESTVVDLTAAPARILRPGMIHAESIAAAGVPVVEGPSATAAGALRSPGLLKKHYAPKAKLLVVKWNDDEELARLVARQAPLASCFVVAHTRIPAGFAAANVSVIPHDAEAYARALYAELHRCDQAGARLIVVEAPPETAEWSGVADRLRRAAA
jgi:L-threonylcarbamoyladenylate synthase